MCDSGGAAKASGTCQPGPSADESGQDYTLLFELFSTYIPIVFLVIGFIGNVLAFLTMRALNNKDSVATFHFKALAIADILAANSLVHAVLQQAAPQLVIPWGVVFCKEYFFNSYYWYGVAVWCVVTLTLDRFIAVCFPLKASTWCTVRKGKIILIINVLVHIPLYFAFWWAEFHAPGDDGIIHEMCLLPAWFPAWLVSMENYIYQIVDAYIPIILVSLANASILWKLRKRSSKSEKLGASQNRRDREDASIVVMLLTMSSAFIIFMLAYPVDYLFWDIFTDDLDVKHPQIRNLCYAVAYLLSCSNNVFNFYMYLLSSSTFRETFAKLVRKWWNRLFKKKPQSSYGEF